MRLAIVIPTIPGREESLARAVASYERTSGIDWVVRIFRDSPSSGQGWLSGVAEHVRLHGPPDYLHLSNDDCEALSPDWWRDPVEACDAGSLPAPIVRNSDGSLQSAGGEMGGGVGNLITTLQDDWAEVDFTPIPFMSWEQWEQIGMQPVHYSSDVWVSHRGRQLGIPTVLRHGYEIAHHMESVGRLDSSVEDQRIVADALAST